MFILSHFLFHSSKLITNFLKEKSYSLKALSGFLGEKGEQGEKGLDGLNGVKGDPGSQGLKGQMGEKGEMGLHGLKGDTGSGSPGFNGLKGSAGVKGDKGLDSVKGEKGDTGVLLADELVKLQTIESDLQKKALGDDQTFHTQASEINNNHLKINENTLKLEHHEQMLISHDIQMQALQQQMNNESMHRLSDAEKKLVNEEIQKIDLLDEKTQNILMQLSENSQNLKKFDEKLSQIAEKSANSSPQLAVLNNQTSQIKLLSEKHQKQEMDIASLNAALQTNVQQMDTALAQSLNFSMTIHEKTSQIKSNAENISLLSEASRQTALKVAENRLEIDAAKLALNDLLNVKLLRQGERMQGLEQRVANLDEFRSGETDKMAIFGKQMEMDLTRIDKLERQMVKVQDFLYSLTNHLGTQVSSLTAANYGSSKKKRSVPPKRDADW